MGGFEDIGQYVSGDDDLLMQKIASDNPRRVRYVTGLETAVHTEAVKDMGEFLARRTRWASKIGGYPSRAAVGLLTLFFFYFTAILLWIPAPSLPNR